MPHKYRIRIRLRILDTTRLEGAVQKRRMWDPSWIPQDPTRSHFLRFCTAPSSRVVSSIRRRMRIRYLCGIHILRTDMYTSLCQFGGCIRRRLQYADTWSFGEDLMGSHTQGHLYCFLHGHVCGIPAGSQGIPQDPTPNAASVWLLQVD